MHSSTQFLVLLEVLVGGLVVVGAAAVYFFAVARQERQLRSEATLVTRGLSGIRDAGTLSKALTAAAAVICEALHAPSLAVVIEGPTEFDECRRHLVRFSRATGSDAVTEVPGQSRDTYFFPFPEDAPSLLYSTDRRRPRTWYFDGRETRRSRLPFRPPPETVTAVGTHGFAAYDAAVEGWRIRWFLELPRGGSHVSLLRPFSLVCEQMTPALHQVYLAHLLRNRAVADERARIGRELHDSVIQSLIGLEMGVSALVSSSPSSKDLLDCTTYVRDTLRDEIAQLRDLMQSFRTIDVSGATLPSHLADLVERFGRHSGIGATFVCETSTERLPRRWCVDIVRIAQEALVNVRKHSGASAVTLRLEGNDSGVTLRVDDNGRGFSFSGRLDDAALWDQRQGPLVIQERARAIGASVAVESTPGRGARVEMSLSYAC